MTRPSISAFFPCYNDAGTIASMVIVADMTLRVLSDDYEIIVVDDGSPDHSGEILAELTRRYPRLRVVTHSINQGYGGALRSGFASATKDLICYTDGDAQYDPREFAVLLRAMHSDVDVVNGYKISRNDSLYRIIIGHLYNHTVRFAFGLSIRDVDCDFRLMRRSVFDRVNLDSDSGVICVEMIRKLQAAKFRFAEVPVHHFARAYGSSQFFRVPHLVKTLRQLFQLWWRLVMRPKRQNPGETAHFAASGD